MGLLFLLPHLQGEVIRCKLRIIANKSNIVALVDVERTFQVLARRAEARPIPSFLFVHSLQVVNSGVNDHQSHQAEQH